MTFLSKQPYKGTRDFYPEDKRIQNYIFDVWRKTAQSFGYEEYGAPILEPLEVYTAKSGQELAGEQTYTFVDRGDRQVAIRPEMTPTISRMVAARRNELAYPARLFSIANFMRYERPQRGREREFWQLNLDMFGVDSPEADAELISYGVEMLRAFGAKDDMYEIRVNDRRVVNEIMHSYLELDEVQAQLMMKLFDRKNKITSEQFRDQAIDIFGANLAASGLEKIAKLIVVRNFADLPDELQQSEKLVPLKSVLSTLERSGVTNARFDVTLMRGLDYYSGTVFEFFDNDPENNRAMFGGGRYDGLVGLFGADPVSAVGMAPGYSTTELFLTSHNLLPKLSSTTELYLVVLGDEIIGDAQKLAREWRKEGLNVEIDITGRKIDKQIKAAVKKQIPYLVIIGSDEIASKTYSFKNLTSTKEEKLSFERIVSAVKDHRPKRDDDDLELFD